MYSAQSFWPGQENSSFERTSDIGLFFFSLNSFSTWQRPYAGEI